MNANELAELIEHLENAKYIGASKAATMLRQQQAEYYSLLVNHDKLYAKVVEQQAEIEALKKHNEELQKACVETLVWVMGNGGYCSLDIEVILKNVLGSEWEDYK